MKLGRGFMRLTIWTRHYLVQQIRPWAWPIPSPVVPLVCGGPLVGVKLPCLDVPHCYLMTGHVHGVGRTMIRPP